MSRDRHADRLHARLAGGAELTADQRRHVATCTDCQRVVADVGRLDDELRAAAAGLATEQIPDADLEPLPVRGSTWMAPIPVVVAVGLIGIVIGFAIGELRPPTGTDATPTPRPVAERSASARPSPSASASAVAMPSPSPTPSPPPEQSSIPLAAGGEICADGTAGFSIVVPDDWYANLRQGDLMACALLAPAAFDPQSELDAPIRLTTSTDPEPAGTVVEESEDAWTVEREDEEWLVHVVELIATIDDEPAYLHLATRAADSVAVVALEEVVDGLTIGDPLVVDSDAVAEADALFADADVCSDLVRGVNVILPDPWWTNTVLGDLLPCSYFASDEFQVGGPGVIPDGVAITLELRGSDVEAAIDAAIEAVAAGGVIGVETLVVDNRAAIRSEAQPPDADVYQFVVGLDSGSLVLTLEGARSDDYERDKAILDEMMRRLVISPTPASVLVEDPLPSCGWELIELTPEGLRFDADARACFWEAHEGGEPAEMISTSHSIEGTVIRNVYRILSGGDVELITDWSHDLGQRPWDIVLCRAIERPADGEPTGTLLFDPTSCDAPVTLEP
jgi:hypothetical protein